MEITPLAICSKTLWEEGETCFSLEPQEEWRFRAADTGCSQEAGAWEVMTALHMQKKQKQLPPFEKPQNESSFHFTFATALTCKKPTPVFLPLKPHGQRSLVGYSPWGCKESHMTEHTHTQHAEIVSSILIWFFFSEALFSLSSKLNKSPQTSIRDLGQWALGWGPPPLSTLLSGRGSSCWLRFAPQQQP